VKEQSETRDAICFFRNVSFQLFSSGCFDSFLARTLQPGIVLEPTNVARPPMNRRLKWNSILSARNLIEEHRTAALRIPWLLRLTIAVIKTVYKIIITLAGDRNSTLPRVARIQTTIDDTLKRDPTRRIPV
jgi:hypothetical protein